jgi:cell division protein FtsL
MAAAMNITGMIAPVDARASARRSVAGITPEFFFQKTIDNTRVVRVADPARRREIRIFSASLAILFLMVMFYAWQHFSAVEYGYKIEAQQTEYDRLTEMNRTLKLEEAKLKDPGRIDVLARQMGLDAPEPGQLVRLENDDSGSAVMARMSPVAVISAQ